MGEPPPLLLLLLSLAGRGAAGESSFQQDLPSEEHYRCLGHSWPIPQQGCRTLPKTYQAEESKMVLDTETVYNQSGSRRPFGAAPGEYLYCPPQRWLHNLKHGGVAFLYHPCAHPSLRGQLTLLARACLPHYILTPHKGLTQEWPLALVARGASLQMAEVELAQAVAWLKRHAAKGGRSKPWAGWRYRHLMRRPAARTAGKDVCPAHWIKALQKLFCRSGTNRRRRELPASDRKGAGKFSHPNGSSERDLAEASRSRDRATVSPSASPNLQAKGKELFEASEAKENSQAAAVPQLGLTSRPQLLRPRLGIRPLVATAQTPRGATQKLDCPCPDGDHHRASGQQMKAAKLHRNCRRSQSLYWTMSCEDGRDTVATVIKRRTLSAQNRRKKRPRQKQHRPLLQTSSESSG
ncbi:tumor protein p53-inducible protein 13 isoform X2 [Sphaerodactylus townsendi]|uniref:tumor protein p53-inducible protein 13 isoform X2 n=1 Tax=Sphaerodactylus townsendi TaxID=933632 RepID=UPI002025C7F4|nr:tumor protein p53-inducible protein 13 isoform X2 [Sphaerodactylus townsendi]